MKIAKVREVKTPERGTALSAGIDFFVPVIDERFIEDFVSKNADYRFTTDETLEKLKIIVKPNCRVLIPSGIKVNFEGEPKMLCAFNKSGVATKKGLDVLACVVDQDYMGEVHISLFNSSDVDVTIMQNEKIVQFVLMPVFYDAVELTVDSELWRVSTDRGEGGFGHTDIETRMSLSKWTPNTEIVRCTNNKGEWELREPKLNPKGYIEAVLKDKRKAYI